MSVTITLTCECGATAPVRAYSLKSRWGTLRLQGGMPDGWKVDGNGAVCPRHHLTVENTKDTWEAIDLRQAYDCVAEHEAELERCQGCR